MTSSQKEFLDHFGWNDFFENQPNPIVINETFKIARVINEERNLYKIQFTADEWRWSSITGKLQFNALSRSDFPAIGDWVVAEFPNNSNRALIHQVLKRKTTLTRKQVGSVQDVQILAANVDTVFTTTSVNNDLNIGRLERYLTFAWDSGAKPVILLSKADLYLGKIEEVIIELKMRFKDVEVFSLSHNQFDQADFFKHYLSHGSTSVLVGSSGVGKSTIGNFLIGKDEMTVQEIRSDEVFLAD